MVNKFDRKPFSHTTFPLNWQNRVARSRKNVSMGMSIQFYCHEAIWARDTFYNLEINFEQCTTHSCLHQPNNIAKGPQCAAKNPSLKILGIQFNFAFLYCLIRPFKICVFRFISLGPNFAVINPGLSVKTMLSHACYCHYDDLQLPGVTFLIATIFSSHD